MKAPSKNISENLRGQKMPGRETKMASAEKPSGGVDMTIPGEGNVETPPGKTGNGRMNVREAGFAGAVGGHFGNSK